MPNEQKKDFTEVEIIEIKRSLYYLKESIEMVEWCLYGGNGTMHLWIKDLPAKMEDFLKHFQEE